MTYCAAHAAYPSTTFQVVPLPERSPGRNWRSVVVAVAGGERGGELGRRALVLAAAFALTRGAAVTVATAARAAVAVTAAAFAATTTAAAFTARAAVAVAAASAAA